MLGHFSHVRLFAFSWTVARQVPLSMRFSRQEYWSGLPFPSTGDLPDPRIKPGSPALKADSLPSEPLLFNYPPTHTNVLFLSAPQTYRVLVSLLFPFPVISVCLCQAHRTMMPGVSPVRWHQAKYPLNKNKQVFRLVVIHFHLSKNVHTLHIYRLVNQVVCIYKFIKWATSKRSTVL